MLRVVLAVSLAVALVAVAAPVVDSARIDHANARVAAELDRLDSAARQLRDRNDVAPSGTAGARRVLRLHLPRRSWGSAGLARLTVPGGGADAAAISWRVTGGERRQFETQVPVVGRDGPVRTHEGGRQRFVLSLQHRDGERVVVVREFKRDDPGTTAHGETA